MHPFHNSILHRISTTAEDLSFKTPSHHSFTSHNHSILSYITPQGTTEGRHYIVRYNQRDLKRYKFINSSTPVTTISHLKPDTDYHFSVKVVSVPNKHSFWSVPTTARTLEAGWCVVACC